MCDLGSTVDPKAIARMLHTDCDHHHCRGHVSSAIEVDQASKHAPTDPTSIIPDFLHCGAWPAADPSTPVTNGDDFLQSTKSSQATEGYASPQHSILPGIDEDSESEGGSSDSDHEVQVRPVRPVTATWEGLSAAVNTWKINDDGSKLEGEVEKSRTPYSVLKLLARHGGGDSQRQPRQGISQFPRQNLFDQEIKAEGQARVEMTEYIDSLVDQAEYEEAYACVWPLEEYRRQGWATEMITAYPAESAAFIEGVNEPSSGQLVEEGEVPTSREQ